MAEDAVRKSGRERKPSNRLRDAEEPERSASAAESEAEAPKGEAKAAKSGKKRDATGIESRGEGDAEPERRRERATEAPIFRPGASERARLFSAESTRRPEGRIDAAYYSKESGRRFRSAEEVAAFLGGGVDVGGAAKRKEERVDGAGNGEDDGMKRKEVRVVVSTRADPSASKRSRLAVVPVSLLRAQDPPVRDRRIFPACDRYGRSRADGYCLAHERLGTSPSAEAVSSAGGAAPSPVEGGASERRRCEGRVEATVRIRTECDACRSPARALVERGAYEKLSRRLGFGGGRRKDPPEGLAEAKSEEGAEGAAGRSAISKDEDSKPAATRPDGLSGANGSSDDRVADAYAGELAPNEPQPPKKSPTLKPLPPGIAIETSRPKNQSGRSICKVLGCTKLDQSSNYGFCRSHYNLLVDDSYKDDGGGEPWVCPCGQSVGPKQKRCGGCFRWKGGVRDAYAVGGKTTEARAPVESGGPTWTCQCGNEVVEFKSRCGKCHHWRGGKRRGGWKLGAKHALRSEEEGPPVDRSTDWECCGEVIPAAKTRCGKCRGWRGGKRKGHWNVDSGTKDRGPHDLLDEEGESMDPFVEWECKKCNNICPGAKKRCAKCASWRFSRKKIRMSAPPSLAGGYDPAAPTKNGGHWMCSCSFDNFATEIRCLMCQTFRPDFDWQEYSKSLPTNTGSDGVAFSESLLAANKATVASRSSLDNAATDNDGGMVFGVSLLAANKATAASRSSLGAVGSNPSNQGFSFHTSDDVKANLDTMTNISDINENATTAVKTMSSSPMDADESDEAIESFHSALHQNESSFSINDHNTNNSSAPTYHTALHFTTFSNTSYLGESINDETGDLDHSAIYSQYEHLLGNATADYIISGGHDGNPGFDASANDENNLSDNIVQV